VSEISPVRVSRAAIRAALSFLVVVLAGITTGCVDQRAQRNEQALNLLNEWFAAAAAGERSDTLCHGLGTLKHPEVSCADMLEHAARIDQATRHVGRLADMDCFGDVCGTFVQIELTSRDQDGNEIHEHALLKQDDGIFRLYWYRSDSLLDLLRAALPDSREAEKDPVQQAYDEITARYPALYQYPPCYDIRVSSSNLRGELMRKDELNIAVIDALAADCGESFCFGLVGNKIAAVCP